MNVVYLPIVRSCISVRPLTDYTFFKTVSLYGCYRINKRGSQKDMEQKRSGNYFFYDDEDNSAAVDDDDL